MKTSSSLTKNYIFQAFYILLTKENYNKISVCDICEKAGVSRMTFYRNFESKDDLIVKGLDTLICEIEQNIKSMNNVNIYVVVKELFECFKKFKDVLPSIKDDPISKTLLVNAITKIKTKIGIDYINKASKYIPTFYLSAVTITIFEWLNNGAVESTDEMARLITTLIVNKKEI